MFSIDKWNTLYIYNIEKFLGIITVNLLEVWPVFTLPTRGIKLITLPPYTSIRYPPVAHLTLRR